MAYNDEYYLQQARQSPGWYNLSGQYDTAAYHQGGKPAYYAPDNIADNPWNYSPSWANSAWRATQASRIPGSGYGTDYPWSVDGQRMDHYHAGNLLNTPADAAMNFGQQWVVPAASYFAARRAFAPLHTKKFAMQGAWRDAYAYMGKPGAQWGYGRAAGHWLGSKAGGLGGRVIGGGLGWLTGFGSGARGAAFGARALGAAGAMAGGAAAFLMGPEMIAAWAASETINKGMFEPWVNSRRTSNAFQSATQNQFIFGGNGNAAGGFGMSHLASARVGSEVTREAWKDMSFSNNDYSQIADYGMQAGLYKDIGSLDSKQVAKKTRKIAEDVSKVMMLFGDKDLQTAIQRIATFVDMGAAVGSETMGRLTGNLRYASAMSGKSASAVMGEIGGIASSAAGAMGVSQASGMIQAASLYAGYSQAHRMGVISTNMLGLYGGYAGLTQAGMSGMGKLAQNPLMQMMLYNQFFGGGMQGDVFSNANKFADLAAGDPMSAMAKMFLHGPEMRDAMMRGNGALSYQPLVQIAKQMQPGQPVNGDHLALVGMANGMTPEEVKAMLLNVRQSQIGSQSEAVQRMQLEAQRQTMETQGGIFGGFGLRVKKYLSDSMSDSVIGGVGVPAANKLWGWSSDKLEQGWTRLKEGGRVDSPFANRDFSIPSGKTVPIKVLVGSSKGITMINDAVTGRYGAGVSALASKVRDGRGSYEDIVRLNSMAGGALSVGEMANLHQDISSGKYKATTQYKKGADIEGVLDTTYNYAMLYSDHLMLYKEHKGPSVWGFNSDTPKEDRLPYLQFMSAMVKGDAQTAGDFLKSLPESQRKRVADLYQSNSGTAGGALFGLAGLIPGMGLLNKNGEVNYEALEKSQKSATDGGFFSKLLQSDSKMQALVSATDEKGRPLSRKEINRRMASASTDVKGLSTNDVSDPRSALRRAEQMMSVASESRKLYQDIEVQKSLSIDGSGEVQSALQGTSTQLFSTAVQQFASKVDQMPSADGSGSVVREGNANFDRAADPEHK